MGASEDRDDATDHDGDTTVSFSREVLPSLNTTDVACLRPMSIKQVLASERPILNQPFIFQDRELGFITLVAGVVRTGADGQLELQDGGEGIVRAYWDQKLLSQRQSDDELEGSYVRVVGKIGRSNRDTNDDETPAQNYLSMKSLRRVKDAHEIFFHVLEVIKASYLHRPTSHPDSRDAEAGVGEIVQSTEQLNLSPALSPREPPAQISVSRTSSFNRNNALGLTDSPLFAQRQGSTESNLNGISSSAQANQSTAEARNQRVAKEPMRTLSSQSTLVDSPQARSPTGTRAPSPSSSRDADPYSHLSNLERAIHLFLLNAKGNGTRECLITDITHGVRNFHRSATDILQALDVLEDVGLIQGGSDEFHFELVDEGQSLYGSPDAVSPPGSFPL